MVLGTGLDKIVLGEAVVSVPSKRHRHVRDRVWSVLGLLSVREHVVVNHDIVVAIRGVRMTVKSQDKPTEDTSTRYLLPIVVSMLLLGRLGVIRPQFIMPPIPAALSVLFEGVGVGLIGAAVGYFVVRILRPTREQFRS